MQGKKTFEPKIFYELSLDRLVPEDDFYRKINSELQLGFLYKATSHYYGNCGQDSIDPVVFFKILLVGYLNNVSSDRALLRFCSDSLAIAFSSATTWTRSFRGIPPYPGRGRFSGRSSL